MRRRLPESNRCTRFCRPVPNHSAKAPRRGIVPAYAGGTTSSRKAVIRWKESIRFESFAIEWPSSG